MLGHSRQSSKLESEDLAFPPSLVGCGRESVAFIKFPPQAICCFVLELPWCRDHPIFKMKKLSLGEKAPRFKVAQLGLESDCQVPVALVEEGGQNKLPPALGPAMKGGDR